MVESTIFYLWNKFDMTMTTLKLKKQYMKNFLITGYKKNSAF